jgi:hypothetical protein
MRYQAVPDQANNRHISNKTRCNPRLESEAIMTQEQIDRYQAESVKRANLPPVAKHSQTKTNQPQKEAA